MPEADLDPRWFVDWPLPLPRSMSVTLAMKADQCPRDAAMYMRDRGNASAGQLYRGSLAHLAIERIMTELMMTGQSSLVALHEGEDPALAAAEVSAMTKGWVDELAEEMRWPVSEQELDEARQCAYNFAVANDVDPGRVVGLEEFMILELGEGCAPLVGRVDLAWLAADNVLEVRDWKSSQSVPSGEELRKSIQTPLYAALLLFGRRYRREECDCKRFLEGGMGSLADALDQADLVCEVCGGLGYVEHVGERLDLEQYVQWVRCVQAYPRHVNKTTGQISMRTVKDPSGSEYWSLPVLRDKVLAAARIWRRIELGVERQWWPAKSSPPDSGHCNYCTARAECPIPSRNRRHAGEILTVEQAVEAWEWSMRQGALVTATRAEVKAFVKGEGLPFIEVGADRYGFVTTHPQSLKKKGQKPDYDGLQEAVEEATQFGRPFDIRDFLVSKPKTDFRKLKPVENEEEVA